MSSDHHAQKCKMWPMRYQIWTRKRFIDRVGSGSSQPPLDLWQKYEVLFCICICVFMYLCIWQSLAAFSLPWVCGRSRKLLSGKIRPCLLVNLHLDTFSAQFHFLFYPSNILVCPHSVLLCSTMITKLLSGATNIWGDNFLFIQIIIKIAINDKMIVIDKWKWWPHAWLTRSWGNEGGW